MIALAFLAAPGLAAERFAPDAAKGKGPAPKDGVFEVETASAGIALTLLDDAARLAFLQERAGTRSDPFAPMPGFPPGFLVFRVRVRNLGPQQLVFQPQAARLELGDHDERSPIAWPDVVDAYASLGLEPPADYAAARPALFDGEEIVRPGGEVERLLPFRRLPPETKRFAAVVTVTTSAGEGVVLEARYRREKR